MKPNKLAITALILFMAAALIPALSNSKPSPQKPIKNTINGMSNMQVFNPEIGVTTCTHDGTMRIKKVTAPTSYEDITFLIIQPDGKTSTCPKGTVVHLPTNIVNELLHIQNLQQ